MMAAGPVDTTLPHKDNGVESIRLILARVTDPEIPVLTIEDLGVLREIRWDKEKLVVEITPTYTGCPAMDTIQQDIIAVLNAEGYTDVEVKTCLSPAWTTDWLSESGRKKLFEFGIVPPVTTSTSKRSLMEQSSEILCPRCHSGNTGLVSEFGSTACKALYRCNDCLEPFDYFKCI